MVRRRELTDAQWQRILRAPAACWWVRQVVESTDTMDQKSMRPSASASARTAANPADHPARILPAHATLPGLGQVRLQPHPLATPLSSSRTVASCPPAS
jgi:hypothetical protein